MALTGVDGSNGISIQDPQQTLASEPSSGRIHGNWHHHHHPDSGDRYSPSTDQAQSTSALGTYSVSQIDLFALIARVSVYQAGTASTNPSTASPSANTSSTTSTQPAQANSSTSSGAPTPAASVQQGVDGAAQSASASIPTTNDSATAVASDSSQPQDPFQALNQALASLGLNQQEIQAFDQVASLINAISPSAFSQIVNTLQQLAQQSTPTPETTSTTMSANSQAAAPSSTSSAPVTSSTSSSPATNGTSQASGSSASSLQIEEIAIQFQAESTTANANSNQTTSGQNGSAQVGASAFSLQIEELNVTLA